MQFILNHFQGFDINHQPLASGYLWLYRSGTDEPVDTYTIGGEEVFVNPWPIQLGADGMATFYCDLTQFPLRFNVTDLNYVQQDNFPQDGIMPPLPPPTITLQPLGGAYTLGYPMTLTCDATPEGCNFQWNKGTDPWSFMVIPGATSKTYMVNSMGTGDYGWYNCVASNVSGSAATSSVQETQIFAKRTNASAVALNDYQILIVGGRDANGILDTACIWNPVTQTASHLPHRMTVAREAPQVVLDTYGKVIIYGGQYPQTFEIFNPLDQSFTAGPALANNMVSYTIVNTSAGVMFPNFEYNAGTKPKVSQYYDSFYNTLVDGPTFPWMYSKAGGGFRVGAITLLNGKVLFFDLGTQINAGTYGLKTLVFNPATGIFTAYVAPSGNNLNSRTAILIKQAPSTNRVLVAGGGSTRMDIWNVATNAWMAGPTSLSTLDPQTCLSSFPASPSDNVLITMGYSTITQIYNPNTNTIATTGNLPTTLAGHTQTSVQRLGGSYPNGLVLLAGGGNFYAASEKCYLWNPASPVWTETGGLA